MTKFMTYKEECESLRRQLENERARDIHSCGPDCTRPGCVNRRLREELAEARQEIADRKADCETGHDQDEATIAELRRQLVEKHVEVKRLKQSHLEEMSAVQIRLAENKDQLAASQAREQQLLEVLRDCYIEFFYVNQQLNAVLDEDGEPLYTEGKTVTSALAKGKEALALPQDTTALEAMIAKAGEVMRERCAHEADPFENITNALATHIAQSIRALPSVTLDDLKGGA